MGLRYPDSKSHASSVVISSVRQESSRMDDSNPETSKPSMFPLRTTSGFQERPSPPPGRNFAASGISNHRSSFAENIRSHPSSPRSPRHPSFTQATVQELLNHPPITKSPNSRFVGRDWRQIQVGELVSKNDVRFVEEETGIEEATKLLIDVGPANVILVQNVAKDQSVCDTFDYNDLNTYLLVVLGLASPGEDEIDLFTDIAKRVRDGIKTTLREIKLITKKAPVVRLCESEDLSKAIESFASGVHRILIVNDGTDQVIGILSQWALVKFLWDNGNCFPIIDQLYPMILKDLNIGTPQAIAINGDKPLTDALRLMGDEGLSSVAVVDNVMNVIGNISTVDVKHLTNTSSLPLLKSSCLHFISVILSERGVENGKDPFPVFHVNPYSTLAHTTAKLIATKSHRMWVVEDSSPSPSAPATPATTTTFLVPPYSSISSSPALTSAFPVVSSKTGVSGRLTGVISLTDILNLFARQSGLHPSDPNNQRQRRRRSSSSSLRPSMDFIQGSGPSMDIRRGDFIP